MIKEIAGRRNLDSADFSFLCERKFSDVVNSDFKARASIFLKSVCSS